MVRPPDAATIKQFRLKIVLLFIPSLLRRQTDADMSIRSPTCWLVLYKVKVCVCDAHTARMFG